MKISPKQQMLNDMIQNIMRFIDQNQDLECVMMVALRGEEGELNHHISYRCETAEAPHYFGHALNDMRKHDMEHLFDDIMGGMACAMIQEGGAVMLEEVLEQAKTKETVH